jgi:hypothetical protein
MKGWSAAYQPQRPDHFSISAPFIHFSLPAPVATYVVPKGEIQPATGVQQPKLTLFFAKPS